MEFAWILFGLVGWAVAILLVFVLMHMAGRQDRIARQVEMVIGLRSAPPAPEPGSPAGSDDPHRISTDGLKRG
jgi:hypothetical protein